LYITIYFRPFRFVKSRKKKEDIYYYYRRRILLLESPHLRVVVLSLLNTGGFGTLVHDESRVSANTHTHTHTHTQIHILKYTKPREYCRMQIRWELHLRCASIKRIAAYKLNIEKIGLSLTIHSASRPRRLHLPDVNPAVLI